MSKSAWIVASVVVLQWGCRSDSEVIPRLASEGRGSGQDAGVVHNEGAAEPAAVVGAAQSVPVRDSAGVEIIENGDLENLPESFRISPEALVDFGGMRDGPAEELYTRFSIMETRRLSDGRWVVADATSMKLFDSQGRYLGSYGRAGSGPGEFIRLFNLCVAPGDTLLATNTSPSRVSVFDSQGTHVRTFNAISGAYFSGREAGYSGELPPTTGCFSDGSLLTVTNVGATTRVGRMGKDGADLGTLGTFQFETRRIADWVGYTNRLVARGRSLFVGDGSKPEVRVFGTDGALVRIVRWEPPHPIPVTAEVAERIVTDVISGRPESPGRNEAQVADRVLRLRTTGWPPTYAVYSEILVDDVDRLWVEEREPIPPYEPEPGYRRWLVFDPSGRAIGRVAHPVIPGSVPRVPRIVNADKDHVLVYWRDEEFGFTHITLHRLMPVGAQ